MPLPMTDFEKMLIKRGRERGLHLGTVLLIEKQLIFKFGELEPELAKEIEALDVKKLQELGIA